MENNFFNMTTKTSFNLDNKVRSRLNLISKKRNIDESELVNIFFTKIFEIWEDNFIEYNYKNNSQNNDFDLDLKFIPVSELSKDDKERLKEAKKYSWKLINI